MRSIIKRIIRHRHKPFPTFIRSFSQCPTLPRLFHQKEDEDYRVFETVPKGLSHKIPGLGLPLDHMEITTKNIRRRAHPKEHFLLPTALHA